MPLVVACSCGKKYRAKDELAGRTLICPSCKTPLRVPVSSPKDMLSDARTNNDQTVLPDASPEDKRRAFVGRRPALWLNVPMALILVWLIYVGLRGNAWQALLPLIILLGPLACVFCALTGRFPRVLVIVGVSSQALGLGLILFVFVLRLLTSDHPGAGHGMLVGSLLIGLVSVAGALFLLRTGSTK